jgi:hypothetical protein
MKIQLHGGGLEECGDGSGGDDGQRNDEEQPRGGS